MMTEHSVHQIKQLIETGQPPEQIAAATGLSNKQIIEVRNNYLELRQRQYRRERNQHNQATYAMSL